ncbi:MAG: hypothetical protein ACF788_02700, partial [Novipirellula sp. JB048]
MFVTSLFSYATNFLENPNINSTGSSEASAARQPGPSGTSDDGTPTAKQIAPQRLTGRLEIPAAETHAGSLQQHRGERRHRFTVQRLLKSCLLKQGRPM